MKPETLEYIKFIYEEDWDDPVYGPDVHQSAKDFEAGIAFQKNKQKLTKRERIAAMAMQGILSNTLYAEYFQSNICLPAKGEVGKFALDIADELIAVLENE